MQVLDQEITAARPVCEKHFDLVRGGRIDLASLGRRFGPLPSLARMFEGADLVHIMAHRELLVLAFVTGFISRTLALGMPDAKRKCCCKHNGLARRGRAAAPQGNLRQVGLGKLSSSPCSPGCRTSGRRLPVPWTSPLCGRWRACPCSRASWLSFASAYLPSTSSWKALRRPGLPAQERRRSGQKRYADWRSEPALQQDKPLCETSDTPLSVFSWFIDRVIPRDDSRRPTVTGAVDQKILLALSSVFHTPQASGIPTKAQNK